MGNILFKECRKLEKIGVIAEATEKKMKIKVARDHACGGNCAQCLSCAGRELYLEADNTGGFKAGEQVRILMEDPVFYKRLLGGYALPTVMFVLGVILGYMLSKSDAASALSGIVLLFATIFCQRIFFKNKSRAFRVEKIK